ncbi:MAG: hypothetical protein HYW86_05265 [Candidatus Roizmanbacteria bacterium]|nr:MAG: hypothetical protein HYW86_05265 [Candidatus Roizmanbacteria bacterium]
MKITVYSITDCPFCKQEKEYLTSHNLQYEEKNLETNKEFLSEMLTLSNNFAGTPVTKIDKDDGQIAVLKGFTKEEFDQALNIQPAAPAVAAVPPVEINSAPVKDETSPALQAAESSINVPPAPASPTTLITQANDSQTPVNPVQVVPEPEPPEPEQPQPTAPEPPPTIPSPLPDKDLTASAQDESANSEPPVQAAESSINIPSDVTTPAQPPAVIPLAPTPAIPETPITASSETEGNKLNSILSDLQSKSENNVAPTPVAANAPVATTPAAPATVPNIPEPDFH